MKLLKMSVFLFSVLFTSSAFSGTDAETEFKKGSDNDLLWFCDYIKEQFKLEKSANYCEDNHSVWHQYKSGELRRSYLFTSNMKNPAKENLGSVPHCVEQSLDGDFNCSGNMTRKAYWLQTDKLNVSCVDKKDESTELDFDISPKHNEKTKVHGRFWLSDGLVQVPFKCDSTKKPVAGGPITGPGDIILEPKNVLLLNCKHKSLIGLQGELDSFKTELDTVNLSKKLFDLETQSAKGWRVDWQCTVDKS